MPVADQRDVYARLKDTSIAPSLAAIDHAGYGFRHEVIKYNAPVSGWMSPGTAHLFSDRNAASGEFARWMIENRECPNICVRGGDQSRPPLGNRL